MDKRTKKRMQVLKEKLQNRRTQLASAKKQPDDLDAIRDLAEEVRRLEHQLNRLQPSE